ncbi:MAG: efflux RND transporter periplasmic adaptor subunit [Xanthomonadales bacterium]|nr:efflux RND transporter periplasmic adaptor subunit [Xanthomonadales bacterium]
MSRATSRFHDSCSDPRPASRGRLHRIFVLFAAGAASLGLAACGGGEKPAGGPGGAGQGGDRPTPVTTIRIQPETFTDSVTAIGTVKARESVTVTAKVSEIVQTVHFDSGQQVRAGDPLITLSDRQQQASLAEAQAAADEAERLYRRQNELAQQQLIARAQLDNQRAARDAAQARVAQIRAQLADRVIRAPFSGVLGLRQVSPGALVTPGVAIATLDDLSRVYVDFPLPEAQLSRVAVGRRINGRATAYPDRAFDGAVTTIDARLDPATRAVQVRADFANGERMLRPGMLMTVEVPGVERQALLLPEIAVTQIGRDSFVFRAKPDDSVEQVKVTVAARRSGKVEIADGLAAGDRIVVEGTGKLRAGGKISEGGPAANGAASPAQPAASTKG